MRLIIISAILLSLAAACSTAPKFDLNDVNPSLTPKSVIAELNAATGQIIIWGGVVLSSQNLKDATQIEVLAYPLDADYMPLLSMEPLGRYIIKHAGYLETTIYEAGRMVSVVGRIEGSQAGKIGEADYIYPMVTSSQLHLWSRDSGRSKTTFHFGFGVQL